MSDNKFHKHTGVDAPRVEGKDVFFPVMSTVPTAPAPNGAMVLYDDGTNRRVYFMINKVWRYTTLT